MHERSMNNLDSRNSRKNMNEYVISVRKSNHPLNTFLSYLAERKCGIRYCIIQSKKVWHVHNGLTEKAGPFWSDSFNFNPTPAKPATHKHMEQKTEKQRMFTCWLISTKKYQFFIPISSAFNFLYRNFNEPKKRDK